LDMGRLRAAAARFPGCVRGPFRDMMECPDGAGAVFALVGGYGGSTVYVPTLRNLFGECLLRGAAEEYDGRNAREIAGWYGYSADYVKRVLRNPGIG